MKHFLKFIGVPITLLILWNLATGYYPDFLWFDSFGYASVWIKMLQMRASIFLLFFAISFAWFYLNTKLAETLSKNSRPFALRFNTPFPAINLLLAWFNEVSAQKKQISKTLFSLAAAAFMGIMAHSKWNTFALFWHQTPYGLTDPIWGQDISFYFFSLPIWSYLQTWVLGLLFISLLNMLWIYSKKGRSPNR